MNQEDTEDSWPPKRTLLVPVSRVDVKTHPLLITMSLLTKNRLLAAVWLMKATGSETLGSWFAAGRV